MTVQIALDHKFINLSLSLSLYTHIYIYIYIYIPSSPAHTNQPINLPYVPRNQLGFPAHTSQENSSKKANTTMPRRNRTNRLQRNHNRNRPNRCCCLFFICVAALVILFMPEVYREWKCSQQVHTYIYILTHFLERKFIYSVI